MLTSSSTMTSAEMVASSNIPVGFSPLSQLSSFDQSWSPAVPKKVWAWAKTVAVKRNTDKKTARWSMVNLLFFISNSVFHSKNDPYFASKNREIWPNMWSKFHFSPQKRPNFATNSRFSPHLARIRHIFPATWHDAVLLQRFNQNRNRILI